jgi:hypothetical protein
MNALRIGTYIISGYTGMMLTVDCSLLTVHCEQSTVNSELEFTIPMLTDLILGIAYFTERPAGLERLPFERFLVLNRLDKRHSA